MPASWSRTTPTRATSAWDGDSEEVDIDEMAEILVGPVMRRHCSGGRGEAAAASKDGTAAVWEEASSWKWKWTLSVCLQGFGGSRYATEAGAATEAEPATVIAGFGFGRPPCPRCLSSVLLLKVI